MVKYFASTLGRILCDPAPCLRFLPAMNNAIIALGNEVQDPENKMLHDLCDSLLTLNWSVWYPLSKPGNPVHWRSTWKGYSNHRQEDSTLFILESAESRIVLISNILEYQQWYLIDELSSTCMFSRSNMHTSLCSLSHFVISALFWTAQCPRPRSALQKTRHKL